MVKKEIDDEFEDLIHKEIRVQCSKRKDRTKGQFFIQLPAEVVRELEIKKGDIITIDIPLKEKYKYAIKLKKQIK